MKTKKLINKSAVAITLSLFTFGCNSIKDTNLPVINKAFATLDINKDANFFLAGTASTFDSSEDAFGHPSPKLSFEDRAKFTVGDSLFDQKWLVAPSSTKDRDGLGPFFNAPSCAACHFRDGRGQPPKDGEVMQTMLLRISIPGKGEHNAPVPTHNYGDQLQGFAIPGLKPEADVKITYEDINGQYSDGETYTLKKPIYQIINPNYGELEKDVMISPRVANQMGGLGMLEDIPESDILALSDPDDKDKDGISGKPNYVWDAENKKLALGRFGWKANQPSIRQQVAGAFSGDVGITSSVFPKDNYSDAEGKVIKAKKIVNGGSPELTEKNFERVVLYSRSLAVPSRRDINNPEIMQGEKLFSQVSCNTCHTTTMKSQGEIIHPYTDLLLHDMGANLADNRPDFLADGNEWRTAPLWTLGLFKTVNGHTKYMHDGRANNMAEAILWHGGEADKSVEKFKNLTKEQRTSLVKFLDSL